MYAGERRWPFAITGSQICVSDTSLTSRITNHRKSSNLSRQCAVQQELRKLCRLLISITKCWCLSVGTRSKDDLVLGCSFGCCPNRRLNVNMQKTETKKRTRQDKLCTTWQTMPDPVMISYTTNKHYCFSRLKNKDTQNVKAKTRWVKQKKTVKQYVLEISLAEILHKGCFSKFFSSLIINFEMTVYFVEDGLRRKRRAFMVSKSSPSTTFLQFDVKTTQMNFNLLRLQWCNAPCSKHRLTTCHMEIMWLLSAG